MQLPSIDQIRAGEGSLLWGWLLPALVLICGLGGTALATYLVLENAEVKNEQRFSEATDQLKEAITSRMEAYAGLLRGGAGLFAANYEVSKEEFRRFYERLQITNAYPGLQGYGYTARVAPEQVNEFVEMVRRQGAPEFRIWPMEAPRPIYHTIVFLEPQDARNRLAIGYDMFTEETRRAAMAAARDSGELKATANLVLVQEQAGGPPQWGFLMYLPVYSGGQVPATLEERREKLQGFVYAPFRANDLFGGMFGKGPPHDIYLRIYDGGVVAAETELYSTPGAPPLEALTSKTNQVMVAGRPWAVVFQRSPEFATTEGGERLLLVPLLGLLATALLLYFTYAERKSRRELEGSAAQLRDQHEWLHVTLSSVGDAVITTDANAQIRFMNPVAEDLTGWTATQAEGKLLREVFDILHEETRQVQECPSTRVLREGKVVNLANHTVLVARDGTERSVDDSAAPIRDRNGTIIGVVLVFHEITERRKFERRITAQHAVTSILAESPALETAAGRLIEAICEHLKFDVGVFWVFDNRLGKAQALKIWHLPNVPLEQFDQASLNFEPAPGVGLPGRVWETGRIAWVYELGQEPNLPRAKEIRESGFKSAVAFPIGNEREVFGAMEFFTRAALEPDVELQHVLRGLGAQIGQFIQRKRAEQALQESESLYRAISETAADGIVMVDESSTILAANPAVEQIFGYSSDELLGKNLSLLMPERMRKAHFEGMKRFLTTGQKKITWSGMELPGLTKSGEEIPLEISFGVSSKGGGFLFTGLIRDISRRKEAEESLREAEQRFSLLVHHAEDYAIIFKDEKGGISHWNPGAERIFGYKEEEVLGKHAAVLFTPEDREQDVPVREMATARETGSASDERWHLRKDGSRFFASGALIWIPGDNERPGSFAKILRDITQKKRAEEAVQELNQELELRVLKRTAALQESKEQMEAFTYTVAHDLRAPLRAMQGFSQALREDYTGQLDKSAHDYLERIMSSAHRMDTLIQDLLAYSQLSRSDLQFQKVSVAEALDNAVSGNAELIQSRAAKIETKVNSLSVHAHASTFQHVLSNLISNAIKFTPPEQKPIVTIRAIEQNDRVKITVQDNGIGIAPEHQARIYRVFERLHSQNEYPGTGIGLAIVKTGVERMGGRVGLVSSPGEGSLFWIELAKAV